MQADSAEPGSQIRYPSETSLWDCFRTEPCPVKCLASTFCFRHFCLSLSSAVVPNLPNAAPFHTIPPVLVTPSHKSILWLPPNYNFVTFLNHNTNIWYTTPRGCDPLVENHSSGFLFVIGPSHFCMAFCLPTREADTGRCHSLCWHRVWWRGCPLAAWGGVWPVGLVRFVCWGTSRVECSDLPLCPAREPACLEDWKEAMALCIWVVLFPRGTGKARGTGSIYQPCDCPNPLFPFELKL